LHPDWRRAAIYALVGVTYNTMFSTSRVMSFTAGQLAMLGGVFGSMFTLKLGMPDHHCFLLTLLGCRDHRDHHRIRRGAAGCLKSLDQHLYVLSTAGAGADDPAGARSNGAPSPSHFPAYRMGQRGV